jgi:hypothetical protein
VDSNKAAIRQTKKKQNGAALKTRQDFSWLFSRLGKD